MKYLFEEMSTNGWYEVFDTKEEVIKYANDMFWHTDEILEQRNRGKTYKLDDDMLVLELDTNRTKDQLLDEENVEYLIVLESNSKCIWSGSTQCMIENCNRLNYEIEQLLDSEGWDDSIKTRVVDLTKPVSEIDEEQQEEYSIAIAELVSMFSTYGTIAQKDGWCE